MSVVRSLMACLLSLILMLGSVTSAVARNEMAGVTDVTLCGTDGIVTVLQIDASGQPVSMGHECPHCLAASVLAVLMAVSVAVGPAPDGQPGLPALATEEPPVQSITPLARGPPRTV